MKLTIVQPIVPKYRVPLYNALASQPGIDLSVISAPRGHEAYDAGHVSGLPYLDDSYPWVSVPPRGALLWQKRLQQVELGGPGDVLTLCGNVRYVSNYPLMLGARRRQVGIVWWGHGHSRNAKPVVERLRLAILRYVDSVLLYTDEEVRLYEGQGLPSDRLFATNNTVNEAPIRVAIAEWDDARLKSFLQERALVRSPIVLYCGRLTARCRLDLALQAVQRLNASGLATTLVVIGDGPQRQALEALAQDLHIASSVRWMGALYNEHELAPWFLSARAFVYPGSIGLSLLHALNYGLPIITHDKREAHGPEIAALDDGVNGLLFNKGNADDLTDKLALILTDRSLQARLSQNALATVRQRYSMQHMIEAFMAAVRCAANNAQKH